MRTDAAAAVPFVHDLGCQPPRWAWHEVLFCPTIPDSLPATDYDYAPKSMLIGRCRVWMNITQEGRDDLDDLQEG